MVHALQESGRVLVPGGRLLDLRPVAATAPVELVTPAGVTRVGAIDGSPGEPDDAACEAATAEVVRGGDLRPHGEQHFDFRFHWSSVGEMARYLATHWVRRRVTPSDEEFAAVRRAAAGQTGPVTVRSHERMLLRTFVKA